MAYVYMYEARVGACIRQKYHNHRACVYTFPGVDVNVLHAPKQTHTGAYLHTAYVYECIHVCNDALICGIVYSRCPGSL